jgi:hypothetical protein
MAEEYTIKIETDLNGLDSLINFDDAEVRRLITEMFLREFKSELQARIKKTFKGDVIRCHLDAILGDYKNEAKKAAVNAVRGAVRKQVDDIAEQLRSTEDDEDDWGDDD